MALLGVVVPLLHLEMKEGWKDYIDPEGIYLPIGGTSGFIFVGENSMNVSPWVIGTTPTRGNGGGRE